MNRLLVAVVTPVAMVTLAVWRPRQDHPADPGHNQGESVAGPHNSLWYFYQEITAKLEVPLFRPGNPWGHHDTPLYRL